MPFAFVRPSAARPNIVSVLAEGRSLPLDAAVADATRAADA